MEPDISTDLKATILARALARSGEARRQRESTGISLRRFAVALGVDPSTLHRWETAQTTPTPDHAARWLDLLNAITSVNTVSWNDVLTVNPAEAATADAGS